MTTAANPRKKLFRASIPLPPGKFALAVEFFRRTDVLLRIAAAVGAAVLMWAVTGAWAPPFPYRLRYTPDRILTSRVEFSVYDEVATQREKENARFRAILYYVHDPARLTQMIGALENNLSTVVGDQPYKKVHPVWSIFVPPPDPQSDIAEDQQKAELQRFRAILRNDENLTGVKAAIQQALAPVKQTGLLRELHSIKERGKQVQIGNQLKIKVQPEGKPQDHLTVDVRKVRIGDVLPEIRNRLEEELQNVFASSDDALVVADHLYAWLSNKIEPTLMFNQTASQQAIDDAIAAVGRQMYQYRVDEPLQEIKAGQPLTAENIAVLKQEHQQFIRQLGFQRKLTHSLADGGMYLALYLLCGTYIFIHHRELFRDFRKYLTLLCFVVLTVAASWLLSGVQWRAELIPLVIFGVTCSIVYQQELSLLLVASVSLVAAISLGLGLSGFVILTATVSSAVLLTRDIRSRTHLIYVGLLAAVVAYCTTLGVGVLTGQPLFETLVYDAAWFAFLTVVAGLLLTALLPFIEQVFDVQTDMSLMELGDISHPLLQELIRRAPGTYNHSINVASIGEAAAEAIGANGLLVRVGAYFHDIGKMVKPGYFIENQDPDKNRHDSLLPAMSTLVIIAHVKDGADLARQHNLPKAMIDFIEQHHGTTLVEYFYRQAERRSESDPDSGQVDETSYRYPGPKPQTKEAAVMMLADAVESASRALSEPGPARIESLVREMAMKRLLDDQFDECNLTLKELHTVEESLIKSLIAVYHGRVKYPSPQTA